MKKSIVPPDLPTILNKKQQETMRKINCIQVGRLEKINDNQTCEISLQLQVRVNDAKSPTKDKVVDMPLLVDCPYVVLSGGKSYIDMPVQKGDFCLVLFNDTNIDLWWSNGQVGEPVNNRRHNIADGIALIGISPDTEARTLDGERVRIMGEKEVHIVGKDGVKIGKDIENGNPMAAARIEDEIKSTKVEDSTFWNWVKAITDKVNSIAAGNLGWPEGKPAKAPIDPVAGPTPSDLTGKITSASDEVQIG